MNRSKHATRQDKQSRMSLVTLLSPDIFLAYHLAYSRMILMNYTMARISDPKANDPK